MLIIAPGLPGPQNPWWAALCVLCPKRWQLPQDRPLYLLDARTDASPQVADVGLPVGLTEMSQAQVPPPTPPQPNHIPLAPL